MIVVKGDVRFTLRPRPRLNVFLRSDGILYNGSPSRRIYEAALPRQDAQQSAC